MGITSSASLPLGNGAASATGTWAEYLDSIDGFVPPTYDRSQTVFRADDLLAMEFPSVRFVVPDILPEGLALLVGKPKIGKSWFTLDLALKEAAHCPVLYLALEDGPRRLRLRLDVLGAKPGETNVEFHTSWPLMPNGLDQLGAWLDANPRCRLVIIDTAAKIRPPRVRNADPYLDDVAVWTPLQQLAQRHDGVAILCIHHQRKGAADDVVDTVLGTQGFAGSVDTILVLQRQRGNPDGTLSVTGRDLVRDQERAIRFEDARWTDEGPTAGRARSDEQRDLLAFLDEPRSIADVAQEFGLTADAARKRLVRAVETGLVRNEGGRPIQFVNAVSVDD
jgi:AAA domain